MANVFSLSTVTAVISNPNSQITIGGAGKMVEQISYSYANEMYSMDSTPDGGWVVNYNGSRAGTVTIQLKQTSSHINELTDFINSCHFGNDYNNVNPDSVGSTIKITDVLGNILMTAEGCYPQKLPDNQVSARAGSRSFTFVAGDITVNVPGGSN